VFYADTITRVVVTTHRVDQNISLTFSVALNRVNFKIFF